jgi:hypothetical protein
MTIDITTGEFIILNYIARKFNITEKEVIKQLIEHSALIFTVEDENIN